jgi:hypothetical protein
LGDEAQQSDMATACGILLPWPLSPQSFPTSHLKSEKQDIHSFGSIGNVDTLGIMNFNSDKKSFGSLCGTHFFLRNVESRCLDFIGPHLTNAHPRARYSAFQALGQTAYDHDPYVAEMLGLI